MLAALQMVGILKESGKKASEALKPFTPLPQILRNVTFDGGKPLEADEVKTAIARAQNTLAQSGRLLVRASGTQALIRVMAEGDNKARIEEVVSDLCAVIEKVAGNA